MVDHIFNVASAPTNSSNGIGDNEHEFNISSLRGYITTKTIEYFALEGLQLKRMHA